MLFYVLCVTAFKKIDQLNVSVEDNSFWASEPLDLSVSLMSTEDEQIRMFIHTESSKLFGFCLSSRPYMDFRARVVSWPDVEHGATECRMARTVNLAMTSDTFPRTHGYSAALHFWRASVSFYSGQIIQFCVILCNWSHVDDLGCILGNLPSILLILNMTLFDCIVMRLKHIASDHKASRDLCLTYHQLLNWKKLS